jgi:hypothetical protein
MRTPLTTIGKSMSSGARAEIERRVDDTTASEGKDMAKVRRTGIPVLVAAGLAAVAGLLAGATVGFNFDSPFGTKKIDRSSDVVLRSMKDMARYQAATANFQVVVDIEKDVKFVPKALAGERALFVAQGKVDGYVDFSGLNEKAIKQSSDGRSVTIMLPSASVTKPDIDTKKSYLVTRERGILDRMGGIFVDNPTSEKDLYLKAEEMMAKAASQTELRRRTEKNTDKMLVGLLQGVGYENVTVNFEKGV